MYSSASRRWPIDAGIEWRDRLCSAAGSTSLASVVASATIDHSRLSRPASAAAAHASSTVAAATTICVGSSRLQHAPPALLGRSLGIAQVAAPQCEADRRAQHERRPLARRYRLQLQKSPADELRRFFIRTRFDEHQTQIEHWAEPRETGRRKLHCRAALRLRLAPTAQVEKDVRSVAAQERAVGQAEAVPRRLGDALLNGRQRLLAAKVKVEQQSSCSRSSA